MNYHLFALLNGWAGRYDRLDDVVEWIATWLIYLVFAIAAVPAVGALVRRRYAVLAQSALALAVAFVGATVLAHLNHELRPFQTHHVHQLIAHDNGVSMPSDHATAAFAIALATYAFLSRPVGAVLTVAAVLIGAARVWVGVHYPGDILVALLIAVAAVGLAGAAGAVWAGGLSGQIQRSTGGR